MLGGETITAAGPRARPRDAQPEPAQLARTICIVTGKNRFFVETFGCQMNVNDSEKIAGLLRVARLRAGGRTPTDADFVFVNTCAVREKATEKLYHSLGRLRRLKKKRPELQIGVGGCVAQLEGADGPRRARRTSTCSWARTTSPRARSCSSSRGERRTRRSTSTARPMPSRSPRRRSRTRAACAPTSPRWRAATTSAASAWCPRTRGPEVNRPAARSSAEVESVVARGYREVMLLGQTVNAYRSGERRLRGPARAGRRGRGPRTPALHDVAPGARRRAPGRCAARPAAPSVPYLHLPVQSGSDRVLASMRRGYTRARVPRHDGAAARPGPATSRSRRDVIVGYPGETEAEFEATLEPSSNRSASTGCSPSPTRRVRGRPRCSSPTTCRTTRSAGGSRC